MVVQLWPDKVAIVREALDEPFRRMEAESQWPALAQTLDALIRANEGIPDCIRETWQLTGAMSLECANAGRPFDRDKAGKNLAATIGAGLTLLRFLAGWVEKVQAQGQDVPSALALQRMIAEVEAVRSEALDNWPWAPTKEEWDAAVAEFERGDSVDVDDAFAAANDMSREEWTRLVEERRRALAGGGD